MLVTKDIFTKQLKAKSILEGGNNKLVLSYQSLRDLGYRKGGRISMYGFVIFTIVQIIEFCHPLSSGYTGFYCAECWDTETLRSIAKIDVFSRSES